MLKTYFNELYDKKFLNDYSDKHFIIRALQGDDAELQKRLSQFQAIPCNNLCFGASLTPYLVPQQGLLSISHENFLLNSSQKIRFLHNVFKDNFDDFIRHQLAAGKENYTDEQFFQAMSEVHLLCYLAFFVGKIMEQHYEPAIFPDGKNPEASFLYSDDSKINIEVKTPDYSNCPHKKYAKWLQPAVAYERSYSQLEAAVKKMGYMLIPPALMKLKDFINSACKKFLIVDNKKEFNILAINYYGHPWGNKAIADGYCSLMNETTGILYSDKVRKGLGISNDIEKISAFILYQCTTETMLNSDLRFSWPYIRLIRNPLCADIDFEKLRQMLHFDTSDYLKPMLPMEEITDLRYYFFHHYPSDINCELHLGKIARELCIAQGLFIK